MITATPLTINQDALQPATGEPQPLEGWSAADVAPDELVTDEWLAEQPDVQPVDLAAHLLATGPGARYSASGTGWTRDTMRRVVARTGLPAVEAWSGHDKGAMGTVVAPLLHHTATSAAAPGDYPTLKVVRDGRPGLENSLSMFGLGRSGTVYLITPRLSWHAGAGAFGGITDGNGHLAGIEAESDGKSWTAAQRDAYPRLVASILLETGRGAEWTPRHADYALPKGRKTDTSGLDLGALRATVARYLADPSQLHANTTPTTKDTPMAPFTGYRNDPAQGGDGAMVLAAPGHWLGVPGPGYPELYAARGVVDSFRNIAPNEFGHFRDVFLSAPAGVGGVATGVGDVQGRQMPLVHAEVVAVRAAVAALAEHNTGLTAEQVEAAVVKALEDNVVQVDVRVGATAEQTLPDNIDPEHLAAVADASPLVAG